MIGDFGANRKAIQKALYDQGIIERIEDDEYKIEENKESSLKEFIIKNIPISTSDYGENAFWVINLEHAQNLFSAPSGFKTAEKILLFFTCERLYVVIAEMKSTLQPFEHSSGINSIYKKIQDSISRFLTLLPYFIFDDKYTNLELRFVGIIIYNNDNLSSFLANRTNWTFSNQESELAEIFKGEKTTLFMNPHPGKTQRVTLKFLQNTDNKSPNTFETNLQDIFSDDKAEDFDFSAAEYNQFIWPDAK